MWKLLIFLIIILYLVYYTTIVMQFLFGVIHFTNRKLSLFRSLVPFYFWFAPINEKTKPEKQRVKPIVKNKK